MRKRRFDWVDMKPNRFEYHMLHVHSDVSELAWVFSEGATKY